jgi:hypothetical protein
VDANAKGKRPGTTKTELWLLCASGLLPRSLRMHTEEIDTSVAERMTQMFGTDIWLESLTAVRRNLLTGTQFRSELTNLMRWRLERDLGYMTTLDFQVINTSGRGIFDMIFATNHWAGEKNHDRALLQGDGTGSFAQEESPAPAPPGQARRRRYPRPVRHDRRRPTTRARKSGFQILSRPTPPRPLYRLPR